MSQLTHVYLNSVANDVLLAEIDIKNPSNDSYGK